MIRRLRDLLAHARAGHRIGCETCGYSSGWLDAGERRVHVPGADSPLSQVWNTVNVIPAITTKADPTARSPVKRSVFAEDWDDPAMDVYDEPSSARPHTLYVADPDELRRSGDL